MLVPPREHHLQAVLWSKVLKSEGNQMTYEALLTPKCCDFKVRQQKNDLKWTSGFWAKK